MCVPCGFFSHASAAYWLFYQWKIWIIQISFQKKRSHGQSDYYTQQKTSSQGKKFRNKLSSEIYLQTILEEYLRKTIALGKKKMVCKWLSDGRKRI